MRKPTRYPCGTNEEQSWFSLPTWKRHAALRDKTWQPRCHREPNYSQTVTYRLERCCKKIKFEVWIPAIQKTKFHLCRARSGVEAAGLARGLEGAPARCRSTETMIRSGSRLRERGRVARGERLLESFVQHFFPVRFLFFCRRSRRLLRVLLFQRPSRFFHECAPFSETKPAPGFQH